MSATAAFLLLLSWPLVISSMRPHARTPNPLNIVARSNSRNIPPLGFYDPRDHGGGWLTVRATVPFLSYLRVHTDTVTLASKQHVPSRLGRANKRHTPRNIRPRGPGRSAKQRRLAQFLLVCRLLRSPTCY